MKGSCLPYGDLLDEVTVLGENLHAGAFVTAVTHYKLARVPHHSNLARVPQLTLLFPRDSKLKFERPCLLEHLQHALQLLSTFPELMKSLCSLRTSSEPPAL